MVLRTAAPESATPKRPPDDGEELMAVTRRAAAGDDAATQRFIQAVWPAMTRVITGVMGPSHADLEDVVQQALIGLLRSLPAFRGECHPAGYASRIALHIALRARRRAGVLRLRTQAMAQLTVEEPFAPSAGDTVAGERRRQVLRDLLHDLPEEQADALALRLVLGWSLEEVAAATGAPVNTIRSRVRLGKEALRRRIEASPELLEELVEDREVER